MNTLTLITTMTVTIAGAFLLGRCTLQPATPNAPLLAKPAVPLVAPKTQVWSCAMHTHIQQNQPGLCPICGMELTQSVTPATHHDSTHARNPASIALTAEAVALANIQTTEVIRQYPEAQVRLVGKLGYDETRIKSLSARFPMRIDELFVSFVGVPVQKGQHLAHIYSPQLRIAQSDLLGAYRLNKNSTLTQSTKEKLRLWGLWPEQITAIIQRGTAQDEFELKAPISGVVIQKNINNGDYLNTGQSLFTIVDLQNLWLSLEAFESDLAWLRLGQPVNFSVDAYPGEIFNGQITFINPEINPQTRTVAIRVNVPNHHKKLKPGMFAKAMVRTKIALAGKVYAPELIGKWISPMHPEIIKDKPGQCDICGMDLVPVEELGYLSADVAAPQSAPIVIPASAILHTGKRAVVYLQTQQNPPTFEGHQIILGPRAGDVFVVNNGLNPGDLVVSHGAFKIDSALQIQAKPSMMNPSQHITHSNDNSQEISLQNTNNALSLEQLKHILPLYFDIQNALANDNFNLTQQPLKALLQTPALPSDVQSLLKPMLASLTINDLRLPHFENLSNRIMQAVNLYTNEFDQPVYQMYCPMAYPERGANWLQQTPIVQNPYFGSAMLKCGENKAQLSHPKEVML